MKAIETERLFLREWQKNDVRDLFDISINTSVGILNEYIESNERWAVELKDAGKVIGSIRVYPDNNRGKIFAKTHVVSCVYTFADCRFSDAAQLDELLLEGHF